MKNSNNFNLEDFEDDTCLKNLKLSIKLIYVFTTSLIYSVPVFFKWLLCFVIPHPLKNVSGQLVLITGGSSGIGKAIAHQFAKEGCNIAIANRNVAMGQQVANEIRKLYSVNAMAFKADVSNPKDIVKLKQDIEHELGHVDILINNAGLLALENSLLEGTDEDYQNIVDTNLTAYFWTTRAFLPGMMERRQGHIVSISSLITKFPVLNAVAYTTTKFGNVGFMEALYADLCFLGYDDCIKTTIVMPSIVVTRKKMAQMVEAISEFPRSNANEIAAIIVRGIRQNRRKFCVPRSAGLLGIFGCLPDDIMKRAKMKFVIKEGLDAYEKIRSS